MSQMTAKEAKKEILTRNKIKIKIAQAEKKLFKYGANFAENQKNLISLQEELKAQYPKFLEAFKFYTVAS